MDFFMRAVDNGGWLRHLTSILSRIVCAVETLGDIARQESQHKISVLLKQ